MYSVAVINIWPCVQNILKKYSIISIVFCIILSDIIYRENITIIQQLRIVCDVVSDRSRIPTDSRLKLYFNNVVIAIIKL